MGHWAAGSTSGSVLTVNPSLYNYRSVTATQSISRSASFISLSVRFPIHKHRSSPIKVDQNQDRCLTSFM